jgi:hypothetical protein
LKIVSFDPSFLGGTFLGLKVNKTFPHSYQNGSFSVPEAQCG